MIKLSEMGVRDCDPQGCGYFGASRGHRKHVGVDLCKPDSSSLDENTIIVAGFRGKVTKIGRVYSDKPHTYVEIKLTDFYCRIFYIDPLVSVGDEITQDTPVGTLMTLGEYFKGITEHVHVEFFSLKEPENVRVNREYVDPTLALEVMR